MEDQRAAFRDIDTLDTFSENGLIEFIQAQYIGADLLQDLIRDLLGVADFRFSLTLVADPQICSQEPFV